MDRDDTEQLTDQIRAEAAQTSPPVDLERIATDEGILLAPSDYGPGFDGRIEFDRRRGKFIIFFQRAGESYPRSRVRFTTAHELGHYFLSAHRALLVSGKAITSKPGFVCDNELEREADHFAASLLLPGKAMNEQLERKKFLTLKDLLELARTWQCSATSAAIRYVQYVSEPVSVVLSREGQILFCIASEDAAYQGFRYLGHKQVPAGTVTEEASGCVGHGKVAGRQSDSQTWFSPRRATCPVWEEAFPLGYTGLVLTLLALELEDEEEE